MDTASMTRTWRWWVTGGMLVGLLLLNVGLAQATFAPIEVTLGASHPAQALIPNSSFTLMFSKTMDRASVERAISVEPPATLEFAWRGGRSLNFRARDGWRPGTVYTISLAASAHHVFTGQPLPAPISWKVQVVSSPRVTEITPQDGAELDELRPTVRIRFDRAMDAASVARRFHLTPETPGRLVWPDPRTLVFEFTTGLAPDTAYTARLDAGATDVQGVPIQEAVAWGWRTLPLVRSHSPSADAILVEPDSALKLSFRYLVDQAAAQAAFHIEPFVPGTFGWAGNTLIFTPTQPLEPDSDYQVRFDGVAVNGAGPTGATAWSFHTRAAVLYMGGRKYAASLEEPVTIEFDRPMDATSVQAALTIQPLTPITLTWEGNRVTLRPQEEWRSGANYLVTLARTARAADGSYPLRRDHYWTFQVIQVRRSLSFRGSAAVHVIDADGRRAIELRTQAVKTLRASLYAMTLPQFLDLYSALSLDDNPYQARPVSTAGLALVREWQTEIAPTDKGIAEITLPADAPPGLYVLSVRAPNVGQDARIVVLTRRALVVKQGQGQVVAWASWMDARPLAGLNLRIYGRGEGTTPVLLAEGTSDAQGLFRADIPPDQEAFVVIAEGDGDITVSGLSSSWRATMDPWEEIWRPAARTDNYTVHITTDRPIYRPGQTVYVKAIIRRDADAVLSLPAPDASAIVRLRDARNNLIGEQTLLPSAFGGIAAQFALADGGTLGTYHVEVAIGDEVHTQPLEVQEYRKPDFLVTVTLTPTQLVQGDTATVSVEARTLFGQPLSGANVELSGLVMEQMWWYGDWGYDDTVVNWEILSEINKRGRTDEQGRWAATVRIPLLANSYFQWDGQARVRIEATVRDGSAEPVTAAAMITVHRAAASLTQSLPKYSFGPGETISVDLVARDIYGQPAAGVAITSGIYVWESRGAQGSSFTRPIVTATLQTDETGRAQAQFRIDRSGQVVLRSRLVDAQGRAVEEENWLSLWAGASNTPWSGEEDALTISADRQKYAAGEVAHLFIYSPVTQTTALLTVERGATHRAQVIQLTGPQTRVDLPILPDDAPNIFVMVNVWQRPVSEDDLARSGWYEQNNPDARLLMASVELEVTPDDRRLQVTLAPDQTTYAPRSEMTLTVRTLNSAGQPVAAEVALAVVDEAIFALSDDLTADPFETFYSPREHTVRTYNSLRPKLGNWSCECGGGGGEWWPANPRWNFPDTAYWNPFVLTGANGEAVVRIQLPDSLTTWRVVARAVSGSETLAGQATAQVVVAQPLSIRPSLPRTLVQGDRATLTAVVRNDGDKPLWALVWIEAQGISVSAPITQHIALPAHGVVVAGWPVVASEVAQARLVFAVQAISTEPPFDPAGRDAVALTLPVEPLATRDVQAASGVVGDAAEQTILIPSSIQPDLSTLEVSLSRSIAATLLEGLEVLTGFPYGCVEQTMSRALPNAVVGRAFRQLGVSNPQLEADLPARINASLQRLYGYQHNDGGWGWWYDDASHDYNTAWVIFGLALTKEAGYTVDDGVIARGAAWLNAHYAHMDRRTQAYALYALALAGHGVLTQTQTLAASASDLDPFSRAALAIALDALGDEAQARILVEGLAAQVKENETQAWWETGIKDGYYDQKTMVSTKRTTALVLNALVRITPDHPLAPKAAAWLMAQRRGLEGWGTTQETAYAIIALTDYILAGQELTAQAGYRLLLNGTLIQEGSLGVGEPATRITVPAELLRSGANVVRIERQGEGRLYYALTARIVVPAESIAAAGNIGVTRAYLDPRTHKPVTKVHAGDLVEVRLTVQVNDESWYVLVEDMLPGGFAALNERLGTTSYVARGYWQGEEFAWERNGYNRKEVHDDRVAFFITQLARGTHTFTYLMRATTAGTFHALPAQVSLMYEPASWGRSASGEIEVEQLSTDSGNGLNG